MLALSRNGEDRPVDFLLALQTSSECQKIWRAAIAYFLLPKWGLLSLWETQKQSLVVPDGTHQSEYNNDLFHVGNVSLLWHSLHHYWLQGSRLATYLHNNSGPITCISETHTHTHKMMHTLTSVNTCIVSSHTYKYTQRCTHFEASRYLVIIEADIVL